MTRNTGNHSDHNTIQILNEVVEVVSKYSDEDSMAALDSCLFEETIELTNEVERMVQALKFLESAVEIHKAKAKIVSDQRRSIESTTDKIKSRLKMFVNALGGSVRGPGFSTWVSNREKLNIEDYVFVYLETLINESGINDNCQQFCERYISSNSEKFAPIKGLVNFLKFEVKISIDTVALRKALSNGEYIPGCSLMSTQSVSIRRGNSDD